MNAQEPSDRKAPLRIIVIGLVVWTLLMAGSAYYGGGDLRSGLVHAAFALLVMGGFIAFWVLLLKSRARR